VSLQQDIADGITAAFVAVGDLANVMYIRRSTVGDYDPSVGTPEQIVNDYQFTGIITETVSQYNEQEQVEEVIKVFVKPEVGLFTIEPALDDELVIDGVPKKVLKITIIKPSETVLLYEMDVERGDCLTHREESLPSSQPRRLILLSRKRPVIFVQG